MNRASGDRFGYRKGGGKGRPRPLSGQTPGKGAGEGSFCINCGKEGRRATECKAPRVDVKEMPCFKCGKEGHMAMHCKNPPMAGAKLCVGELRAGEPGYSLFLDYGELAGDLGNAECNPSLTGLAPVSTSTVPEGQGMRKTKMRNQRRRKVKLTTCRCNGCEGPLALI